MSACNVCLDTKYSQSSCQPSARLLEATCAHPLRPSYRSLTYSLQWKVLVVDPDSRRLIDNVLEEDAILNENITRTYVHTASQLSRIHLRRLIPQPRH